MSYRRTAKKAPYDQARKNGAISVSGRPICRWCGSEVAAPRRNWCSDECVHQRKIRSDTHYMREVVFERDLGICKECGLDTKEMTFERWAWKTHPEVSPSDHLTRMLLALEWEEIIRPLGFYPGKSLWEADHIIPVSEGGGACGIENIRSLCVPCHRKRSSNQLSLRNTRRNKSRRKTR